MDLRSLLGGLPEVIQYIAVLGLIMLILYVCLIITRFCGQKYGKKVYYDNPEEYEKTVPDLFASTFLKRKIKKNKSETKDAE